MKLTFGKVRKTLSVLMAVFFIVAVTAGAVSSQKWNPFVAKSSTDGVRSVVAVGNGAPGGNGGYATGGKIVIATYNSASNDADFDASNDADVKQSNKLPVLTFSGILSGKYSEVEVEDLEAENEVGVEDIEQENEANIDQNAEIDADVDQDATAEQDVTNEDVYAYGGEAYGGDGGDGGDENVANIGFIGNNEDWDGDVTTEIE